MAKQRRRRVADTSCQQHACCPHALAPIYGRHSRTASQKTRKHAIAHSHSSRALVARQPCAPTTCRAPLLVHFLAHATQQPPPVRARSPEAPPSQCQRASGQLPRV
eukprot:scaffold7841_cov128-Isochrysis_galbana.AAC.7